MPTQLADENSFAARLARILEVRAGHRIATSVQVDVPLPADPATLVMIHLLDTGRMQATVLHFADRIVTGPLVSDHLPAGAVVTDMFTHKRVARIDEHGACTVSLQAYQGMSLLIGSPPFR